MELIRGADDVFSDELQERQGTAGSGQGGDGWAGVLSTGAVRAGREGWGPLLRRAALSGAAQVVRSSAGEGWTDCEGIRPIRNLLPSWASENVWPVLGHEVLGPPTVRPVNREAAHARAKHWRRVDAAAIIGRAVGGLIRKVF